MTNTTLDGSRIFARRATLAVLTLALSLGAVPAGAGEEDAEEFETAEIRFEQNATDGDVEVVIKITGGDEGMQELSVVSPDGRMVVDFKAPDASTLGIRQFVLESPEPTDIPGLKAAYPEGIYRLEGRTVSGDDLAGEMELSHELPPPTSRFGYAKGQITWSPVAGVEAYIVEIEQEELGTEVTATLSGKTTTFSVPQGFLIPGTEYGLGLGTVSEDGNMSFVETTFSVGAD